MRDKKAQSTVEFMVLVAGVLLFFTAFLYVVQNNISDKAKEERSEAIRDIGLIVQDEVILASESSDGYVRNFVLPNDVFGMDYYVNISEELVYIRTADGKYAMALPVFNVTGQPQKGNNVIR